MPHKYMVNAITHPYPSRSKYSLVEQNRDPGSGRIGLLCFGMIHSNQSELIINQIINWIVQWDGIFRVMRPVAIL